MNDVITIGPIFDGRAEAELERYVSDLKETLGNEGVNRVRAHLDSVLRHQTGRYVAGVHTDRSVGDLAVRDAQVVYGPWLEGVGSRNSPATRFPGYHTFRIVGQDLDRAAEGIAERKLHEGYLQGMQ